MKDMKVYKIHEMAEKLGVSIKTLQRWDNTGKNRNDLRHLLEC